MAKPTILGSNAYDATVLNPTYVVDNMSADDAVDREAFRVGDNLRDLTSWTSVAANAERSLRVDGQVNNAISASVIVLDTRHNLAGKAVVLEHSNDQTFAAIGGTPVSATIPASAGGLASDANGCLTPEGVWWKTFTQASGRAWRLRIPAMGAGISPIVTGLYLGVAHRFPEYLEAPAAYDYRSRVSYKRNELSEGAVRGKSRPRRFGELKLRLQLEPADFPAFNAEVDRLLDYDHPWWFCLDDGDAAGCALMRIFTVPGDLTYDPVVNPVHREIEIDLEALIPRLTI